MPAQPPSKGKTPPKPPPAKEEEDPNAKPVKPPPQLDDTPKPDAAAEGPGVVPPADVLVVGVHDLPQFMSPQFARSEAERFALDLLFEGLLRPGVDGAGGRVYEPGLARDLPALVPLGRLFTLADAAWADPAQPNLREPVTAADVAATVEKLKKRKGQPGAEVADWIDTVTTDADKRCRVILSRGHIDPLALMTFKVLPANRKDDLSFARTPVGSGPFVYGGTRLQGGREYALFPANLSYGRSDRPNLPRLKAVWMVTSRNPVADVKGGLIHFALTTHTGELAVLKPAPQPAVDGPRPAGKLEVNIGTAGRVDTLFGRRVYFLAVNHQDPKLGGDAGRELRRFLAFAIQRDAILTACFRAGFAKHHQPLTGPFPPDTWPCHDHPARLDDADLARTIRKSVVGKIDLELKYPDGDPAVTEACKLMAEQVAGLNAGVTIKPKAVPVADYYRVVFQERDFQLAYWHYDYADDWFSPAGLFDPGSQEFLGRNFMRYMPPAEMQQILARCLDRRDFGVVRTAMRQLHGTFAAEMPFIPLWHLDTHALLAAGLTTVPLAAQIDPLAPFTHIEQWSLGR